MTAVSFTVPAIGGSALSSNGGRRSRRDPWSVAKAKGELGEAAYFAALQELGPNVPALTPPVDILLDFHIAVGKRPGDGQYRFVDPFNGGGEVAKPIVDYGIVKPGIIPDDSYLYVRYGICHVTRVATLEEERIEVTVREVGE